MTEITDLNTALKAFNSLTDARDRLRHTYEARERKLKDAQFEVELFLLEEMKRLNLSACEVPGEGVANIRIKRRFGVADWGTFWTWVIENKNPEILQKRLLDTGVQAWLDEHGTLPPAVNSEAKMVIAVTKRPPKEMK